MIKGKSWNDSDIELYLSRLMRYGIVLASAIVITGCIIFLAKNGTSIPKYSKFIGEPEQLTNVPGIFSSFLTFSGKGFIEFGLLILISIPVLRVAFSLVSFAVEKDRTYVFITLAVLVLLLYSLFGQH
jgi:uncharacterized membrane protein